MQMTTKMSLLQYSFHLKQSFWDGQGEIHHQNYFAQFIVYLHSNYMTKNKSHIAFKDISI